MCGERPTVRELIDYEAFCGVGAEPTTHEGVEVTVGELADEVKENPNVVLVDVRESYEWEICHIRDAVLIPLGELPDRLNEFEGQTDIVTYCHTGVRSLRALEILKAAGFSKVRSLRGGIDAWAVEVDPTLARY